MTSTAAYDYKTSSSLNLNIVDYPGGVAIWGALPAVFDTTTQGFDQGVHVHARLARAGKKVIDQTYKAVNVIWGKAQYHITEEIAVNFSLASIFNHKIISLKCSRCSHLIISSQLLSLIPHHEHICNMCGYINVTTEACVINPVIDLKQKLGDGIIKRHSVLPNRTIKLDFEKYPGGVQIWGSNPSIIWTADRQEESAIHVHAYTSHGKRIVDNTYSEVWLGDELLDIEMIRVWQIQQSIMDLHVKVEVADCPDCGVSQFDRGIYAILPQKTRRCQTCSFSFTTREAIISNPVVGILNKFKHGGDHA